MDPLLNNKELFLALQKDIREIKDKLGRIEIKIAELKIKASIWGLIAGAIPAIGTAILYVLIKYI